MTLLRGTAFRSTPGHSGSRLNRALSLLADSRILDCLTPDESPLRRAAIALPPCSQTAHHHSIERSPPPIESCGVQQTQSSRCYVDAQVEIAKPSRSGRSNHGDGFDSLNAAPANRNALRRPGFEHPE